MNSTYTNPTPDDGNLTVDRLIEAYEMFERKVAATPDTIRCNSSMADMAHAIASASSSTSGTMTLPGFRVEVTDALPHSTILAGRYVRDGGRLVFKPMTMYQRKDDGKWVEYDWDVLMALGG